AVTEPGGDAGPHRALAVAAVGQGLGLEAVGEQVAADERDGHCRCLWVVKKVWTLGLPGDYPRLPGSFTGRLRRAREVGGVHASLVTSSRETLGRSSIDLANTKFWTPQARAREARGKGLSRGLGLVVLVAKDVRVRSNPSRP